MIKPQRSSEFLTPGQQLITTSFFQLPESEGFVIAGGLALIANRTTARPTEDIVLFTNRAETIRLAAQALQSFCIKSGWEVQVEREYGTFIQLTVTLLGESIVVDLAHDSPLLFSPSQSSIGPTVSDEEALGRKLCAVFGRTEARDFFDLFILVQKFSKSRAVELAFQIDTGFDLKVAGVMMRRITKLDDFDFPCDLQMTAALRSFFENWANEIDSLNS